MHPSMSVPLFKSFLVTSLAPLFTNICNLILRMMLEMLLYTASHKGHNLALFREFHE